MTTARCARRRARGRSARLQLVAARAKLDYADRLVELREAEIDEAEVALAAARRPTSS